MDPAAMATLREYNLLKDHIRTLEARLESLEQDPQIAQDFQLLDELRTLLDRYEISAAHAGELIEVMHPGSATKVSGRKGVKGSGMQTSLKIYRNPYSGEVVKTYGGNQKRLKEWRQKYGKEEVASWREQ